VRRCSGHVRTAFPASFLPLRVPPETGVRDVAGQIQGDGRRIFASALCLPIVFCFPCILLVRPLRFRKAKG